MHNSGCLGSVMVPWGYIFGCNWHMQLSLTCSAFHYRNAIDHFRCPLVLISPSYWICIFSMTEMNVRNVKSRVINWESACNPVAPLAVCIPLLWFDRSFWYPMICLGSWETGHQEPNCQNCYYSHSHIAVQVWRAAQETCDLSKLLCRLDHVPWACILYKKWESFSEDIVVAFWASIWDPWSLF